MDHVVLRAGAREHRADGGVVLPGHEGRGLERGGAQRRVACEPVAAYVAGDDEPADGGRVLRHGGGDGRLAAQGGVSPPAAAGQLVERPELSRPVAGGPSLGTHAVPEVADREVRVATRRRGVLSRPHPGLRAQLLVADLRGEVVAGRGPSRGGGEAQQHHRENGDHGGGRAVSWLGRHAPQW